MRTGVITDPTTGLEYFTGYAYHTLYDWDQFFDTLILIAMDWPAHLSQNAIRIFLNHQREDGFIARSVPSTPTHDHEHVKPFLAQIAHLSTVARNNIDWLLEPGLLTGLQRYLDYWLNTMDSTNSGLSDWMSAPHTGMDNQHERAGYWLDRVSQGVDLNCYLVRECRALAALLRLAGQDEQASAREQQAEARASRIRQRLWDEETGFFYDGNLRAQSDTFCDSAPRGSQLWTPVSDKQIRVRSIAAFSTLWARVATPEQARRMVHEHLLDNNGFASPYPVPTLARTERWYSQTPLPADIGCSWRANTWVPTNYMLARGLRHYGYHDEAKRIDTATMELVNKAGFREYYNAETGEGCGLNPFWGWSTLACFTDDDRLALML
ncbi:MGH1-like glycoside hydrolase domain-containing protein [Mucisphaera calidilacus]|nr:trehalase family glycosidase [Mucisphaera calidilacus]